MGATIRQDESGIWVVHITGALRKEEMDASRLSGSRRWGLMKTRDCWSWLGRISAAGWGVRSGAT